MRTPWCIAAVSVLVLVSSVHAALSETQRATLLAEAQAAYDRGTAVLPTDAVEARESFRLAATRFQQLVDDGVSNGGLHYNLGNAYLQAGDLGLAILNYRAAQTHDPGNASLVHNLEHARSLRRNRIAPSGDRALRDALLGWHDGIGLATRFAIFAAAWCGFWILLTVMFVRRLPGAAWALGVCAVLAIATGVSVGIDLVQGPTPVGVVLDDEVVVRKGNGDGFEPQFEETLHQGVEFVVLDERPGWLEIELPNATTGWIRRDQAGIVAGRG